jgi:microtubule-binding protein TANGLED1
MARLQELQYTVAGGAKVVSGVSLSPRSTRGYLRTSLRCKQETVRQVFWLYSPSEFGPRSWLTRANSVSYSDSCRRRMRGGASAQKRSPSGKFGGGVGGEGAQWRRMSLPAMLLGETVLEIVQASQFARDIVTAAGATNREPPRTPKPAPRTRKPAAGEPTPLRARRAREKQSHRGGAATRGADAATPPSRSRVRSRIQFKPVSPVAVGRPSVSANRVSPKNRPWAKKAVMFPNPTFHASTSAATDPCATPSPSKKQKRLYKTRSPVAARQTPHKFLVKSPPSALGSKLRMHGKALPARPAAVSPPPPVKAQASPAKTRRCSFSPSRLATRLMSPIKARLSLGRSRDSGVGVGGGPMSGLKQRPGVSLTVRTVSSKISSR